MSTSEEWSDNEGWMEQTQSYMELRGSKKSYRTPGCSDHEAPQVGHDKEYLTQEESSIWGSKDDEEYWTVTTRKSMGVWSTRVQPEDQPVVVGAMDAQSEEVVTWGDLRGDGREDWQVTTTDDGGLDGMMGTPVGHNNAPVVVGDQSEEGVTRETGRR